MCSRRGVRRDLAADGDVSRRATRRGETLGEPIRVSLRRQLQPEWMSDDVALLMVARATMSAGRALAGVIVPIYLAKIGFSSLKLGVLFAVVGLVSAVMSASIGLLSDRFGRKPFIIIVPMLAAGASVGYALSEATTVLFACAAIGTFGRGAGAGGGTVGPYQPAEQAFVTDATPTGHRNAMFGRLAFFSALGALIGGQLARIPEIAAHMGLGGVAAYRPAFAMAAVLPLTAALLAMPVREPPRDVAPNQRLVRLPKESWGFLLKLWAANTVNGAAVGFVGPFLTYWFYRRYGVGPGAIGLLYSLVNAASMVSNLGAASIAERLGLVRAVVIGRALQAALLGVMVAMPTFWLAGSVYLIRMLAQRVAMPLRQSYVLGMVPAEERSSVAGLANVPSQATSAASPALAGYLFDNIGLWVPFGIGAVLQGVNTALFYAFFHNLPPPEERVVEVTAPDVAETRVDRG
jgi:MFS family permease